MPVDCILWLTFCEACLFIMTVKPEISLFCLHSPRVFLCRDHIYNFYVLSFQYMPSGLMTVVAKFGQTNINLTEY